MLHPLCSLAQALRPTLGESGGVPQLWGRARAYPLDLCVWNCRVGPETFPRCRTGSHAVGGYRACVCVCVTPGENVSLCPPSSDIPNSDSESFNPSLWEEQRKQRAQVAFECDEDKDERETPPRVSTGTHTHLYIQNMNTHAHTHTYTEHEYTHTYTEHEYTHTHTSTYIQ